MIKLLEKNRLIAFIFTLLIAVEIFAFSSISGTSISAGNIWFSRIYHMAVFFLLNFFLFILMNKGRKITFMNLSFSLIISLAYAASDEIHQIFVPFRSAGIDDFLTDSIGIFFSAVLYLYYKIRNNN